ncbi:hypothetical protein ACEQPO_28650 [Bacillus sp. SL00103]
MNGFNRISRREGHAVLQGRLPLKDIYKHCVTELFLIHASLLLSVHCFSF